MQPGLITESLLFVPMVGATGATNEATNLPAYVLFPHDRVPLHFYDSPYERSPYGDFTSNSGYPSLSFL